MTARHSAATPWAWAQLPGVTVDYWRNAVFRPRAGWLRWLHSSRHPEQCHACHHALPSPREKWTERRGK
jgi:hypothetical protein